MKAIVALSGGMDSATVLAHAIHVDVVTVRRAVGFTYGSKHNSYENDAARKVASYYSLPFQLIDLAPIMENFKSDLLKSGGEVPEGHYEEASMSRTVVPGRNIIFSSILAGLAWSLEVDYIYLGIHAGDHFIYPDCRPLFFFAMKEAILQGTDNKVELKAPFISKTKSDILKHGYSLSSAVPYYLTRTCYKDQIVACGKCGSCQERLEAYSKIGKEDPLPYETRELKPKKAG